MYMDKTGIRVAGHAVFAVLCIMALWCWQERTLILDAAFQSYLFIATGRPAIMVERFGAAMVQLLPLAGVWTGAPLQVVLMLYSVSIVLFHWVLFSICLHGLKDGKAALAILLFNVLFVSDSFFWMQNELLQAISLMFVLWSIWLKGVGKRRFTAREYVWIAVLSVTVIYYHPLVFFPLAFCWLRLWLTATTNDNNDAISTPLLTLASFFALVFSSKYIFRQPNFYDRGMTGQYVREFNLSPQRLLHSQSLRDFTAHLDDNLVLLIPLLVLVTVFYLAKKRYWLAALTPAFVLLYCLLIMQRFLDDDRWYIQESHYQALAVFLIVPLVWDILPGIFPGLMHKWSDNFKSSGHYPGLQRWIPVLFLILLFIRIGGIWSTGHNYTARLAYVHGLLDKAKGMDGRKLVVDEKETNLKTLMMYWGLPFEIWQMSALESPDSVRVLAISANPDSLAGRLAPDSMVTFLMIPPVAFRDMPGGYYRMRDTAPYRVVKSERQAPVR